MPILFYIFSFWTGSAVLVGLFTWLRDIETGRHQGRILAQEVYVWLFRGFFMTLLSSLALIATDFRSFSFTTFWPEILLLGVFVLLFGVDGARRVKDAGGVSVPQLYLLEVFHLLFLLLTAVFMWSLSLFIGLSIVYISIWLSYTSVGQVFPFMPVRDAVLVLGGLWVLPFVYFFRSAQEKAASGDIVLPKNFKFYQIIWPILLALLIYMIPLVVEQALHSEKMQAIREIKPVPRVI